MARLSKQWPTLSPQLETVIIGLHHLLNIISIGNISIIFSFQGAHLSSLLAQSSGAITVSLQKVLISILSIGLIYDFYINFIIIMFM